MNTRKPVQIQACHEDHLQMGIFHETERTRSPSPIISGAVLENESAQSKGKKLHCLVASFTHYGDASLLSTHSPALLGCRWLELTKDQAARNKKSMVARFPHPFLRVFTCTEQRGIKADVWNHRTRRKWRGVYSGVSQSVVPRPSISESAGWVLKKTDSWPHPGPTGRWPGTWI